jgi:hypothetical protein
MPKFLQILLIAIFALIGASAFAPPSAVTTRGAFVAPAHQARHAITTPLSMAGPATLEPTKTDEKKKTEEPIKEDQKQGSEGWEVSFECHGLFGMLWLGWHIILRGSTQRHIVHLETSDIMCCAIISPNALLFITHY